MRLDVLLVELSATRVAVMLLACRYWRLILQAAAATLLGDNVRRSQHGVLNTTAPTAVDHA